MCGTQHPALLDGANERVDGTGTLGARFCAAYKKTGRKMKVAIECYTV